MTTLEDRQKADRERAKRWRENQNKQGKKAIGGTVSSKAYDVLNLAKDKLGDTFSATLEKALLLYGETLNKEK